MYLTFSSHPGAAVADVRGACEVPLTRGVVVYRDRSEVEPTGGRAEDIGLGVVVEGRFAAEARVVDLGSGRVVSADLSGDLLLLDWLSGATMDHLRALQGRATMSEGGRGEGPGTAESEFTEFCFGLALRILKRSGLGPLTRSTVLRIGFRDISRDLDPHEETAIRVAAGPGSLLRLHMDYDAGSLVVRTARSSRDPRVERALMDSFPGGELRRKVRPSAAGTLEYSIRFRLPADFNDVRTLFDELREGFIQLMSRYEPERHDVLENMLRTFGARETLLKLEPTALEAPTVRVPPPTAGSSMVH